MEEAEVRKAIDRALDCVVRPLYLLAERVRLLTVALQDHLEFDNLGEADASFAPFLEACSRVYDASDAYEVVLEYTTRSRARAVALFTQRVTSETQAGKLRSARRLLFLAKWEQHECALLGDYRKLPRVPPADIQGLAHRAARGEDVAAPWAVPSPPPEEEEAVSPAVAAESGPTPGAAPPSAAVDPMELDSFLESLVLPRQTPVPAGADDGEAPLASPFTPTAQGKRKRSQREAEPETVAAPPTIPTPPPAAPSATPGGGRVTRRAAARQTTLPAAPKGRITTSGKKSGSTPTPATNNMGEVAATIWISGPCDKCVASGRPCTKANPNGLRCDRCANPPTHKAACMYGGLSTTGEFKSSTNAVLGVYNGAGFALRSNSREPHTTLQAIQVAREFEKSGRLIRVLDQAALQGRLFHRSDHLTLIGTAKGPTPYPPREQLKELAAACATSQAVSAAMAGDGRAAADAEVVEISEDEDEAPPPPKKARVSSAAKAGSGVADKKTKPVPSTSSSGKARAGAEVLPKEEFEPFDLDLAREGRERANFLVEQIWANARELVGIRRREQRLSGEPFGSDFAPGLPEAVSFADKFASDPNAVVLRDILKEDA